jgi:hypothetical protein
MSVYNIFTELPVPSKIASLFLQRTLPTSETITLKPADHPWYNYAVLKGVIPITPITEYKKDDIVGEGFYPLVLEEGEAKEELAFLDTMGLLVKRESGVYVSPLAEILYGPTGPFQMGITSLKEWGKSGPGKPTTQQQRDALIPIGNFMRGYVLPGRMWRAFVAKGALPPTIALSTNLGGEIAAMSKMMADLGVIIGSPKSKNMSAQTNGPLPEKRTVNIQTTPPPSPSAPAPSAPPAAGGETTIPPKPTVAETTIPPKPTVAETTAPPKPTVAETTAPPKPTVAETTAPKPTVAVMASLPPPGPPAPAATSSAAAAQPPAAKLPAPAPNAKKSNP